MGFTVLSVVCVKSSLTGTMLVDNASCAGIDGVLLKHSLFFMRESWVGVSGFYFTEWN